MIARTLYHLNMLPRASVRVGGRVLYRFPQATAAGGGESEREGVYGTERAPRRQEQSPRAVDYPERRSHLRRAIVRDAGAL